MSKSETTSLICRMTGHWLRVEPWFQTPHGWQRDLNCRFCWYHTHEESIGWEKPSDARLKLEGL